MRWKSFEKSQESFGNPLMGYAPAAWNLQVREDVRLLYMDITWRELEPEEGSFDWSAIEQKNQTARWRAEGRHLILRFLMDRPGTEMHRDIPDWLYEKTGGTGASYDTEYGCGFSPDYRDPVLRAYHARAVQALGEHFGSDGLICFIELGSLGHWGEWHVSSKAGIPPFPKTEIREEYVKAWMEAFPDAKLLMRSPFAIAARQHFGLYNDMTGAKDSTTAWLAQIEQGGTYWQTGEVQGLRQMREFWRYAPSGGEFTSAYTMEYLLKEELEQTIRLVRAAHTTFLGPLAADDEYEAGYREILVNMGYRIRISRAAVRRSWRKSVLILIWENDGTAPMYADWPVHLYLEDRDGKILETERVNLRLSDIEPGRQIKTVTPFSSGRWSKGTPTAGERLSIGITDPMTGYDCVRFAMETEYKSGRNYLF